MALSDVGKLWRFLRRVEDLIERDAVLNAAIRRLSEQLAGLDQRLSRLEAQQGIVVAEAKGAAAATGAAAAAQAITDFARRLGALEERSGRAAPDSSKRPKLRRPADPDPEGTA